MVDNYENNAEVISRYRHHLPHFGGGIKQEGKDWRVPHFKYLVEEQLAAQRAEGQFAFALF